MYCQTYDLPDIIPPSPGAQEFENYINYSMDLSVGLPSVNVPLYNIKTSRLQLPISISYRYSGLKPNTDESGIIGLGWHLNCFGIISRNIKVKRDESVYKYLIPIADTFSVNLTSGVDDPNADILENTVNQIVDYSHDIFSYSLPNSESGHFYLRRFLDKDDFFNTDNNPILMPYANTKIKVNSMASFDITDEKGIFYRFGKSITSGNNVREIYRDLNSSSVQGYSSWLLTEMISADKSDTIKFEYTDLKCSISTSDSTNLCKINRTYYRSFINREGSLANYTGNGEGPQYTEYIYSQKLISKITFSGGKVCFNYNDGYYPDLMLDNIKVYSDDIEEPIKVINFYQSSYHTDDDTHMNWNKIDSLSVCDANDIICKQYKFTYKSCATSNFPEIDFSQIQSAGAYYNYLTNAIDYWGYFNGATNSDGTLPGDFSKTLDGGTWELFGDADRDPESSHAKVGALETITFPTGGTESFSYEGNEDNNGNAVGGIRISKVVYDLDDGESLQRTYTYTGVSIKPTLAYYLSHTINIYDQTQLGQNIYTANSEPSADINIDGMPIVYSKVIEYYGTKTSNTGYVKHVFDTSFLYSYISWYNPAITSSKYPWNSCDAPLWEYYKNVKYGKINEKTTEYYDTGGNLTKSIINKFSNNVTDTIKDFNVKLLVDYTSTSLTSGYRKVYNYSFYNSFAFQLKQQLDTTIINDINGNWSKEDSYTYNDKLLIKTQKENNSNNDVIIQNYKYPGDIDNGIYSSMADSNMLNYPIEVVKSVNGNIVSGVLKTYSLENNSYLPSSVYKIDTTEPLTSFTYFNGTKKDNNYSSVAEVAYDSYDDYGNPTQITTKDGITTSYLWGYDHQYPVAKVVNATFSDVETYVSEDDVQSPSDDDALRTNLDKIRTGLSDAQVTTYTYSPLIGMTSETDPNGRTTYYEYDDLNRLEYIRDQNQNILKKYNYHYITEGTYSDNDSSGDSDDGSSDEESYITVSETSVTIYLTDGEVVEGNDLVTVSVESNTTWSVTNYTNSDYFYVAKTEDGTSVNIQLIQGPGDSSSLFSTVTLTTDDGNASVTIKVTAKGDTYK